MTEPIGASQFLTGFIAEAEEHISGAAARLVELSAAAEEERAAPRPVRELYRSLHTLKGLAAMVAVEPIVEIAHALESLLKEADARGGRMNPLAIDVVAQGIRSIEERVRQLRDHEPVAPAPGELLQRLSEVEAPAAAEASAALSELGEQLLGRLDASEREMLEQGLAAGRAAILVHFASSKERHERGLTITSVRARLEERAELVKVVPLAVSRNEKTPGGVCFTLLLLSDEQPEALARAAGLEPETASYALPPAKRPPVIYDETRDEAPLAAGTVRVDVSRLDNALDRLSDLVITGLRLEAAVTKLGASGVDIRELREIGAEHRRRLKGLRTAIMQARMVRVSEMLARVPLLVRGMTREQGKKVRLELKAGSEELDKGVADRLFQAVVHLVRNAIDHGIELPAERIARGKPEVGRLTISCESGARGFLEFVVDDDGVGIDREAVAARAGANVPTSDAELLALLARPGLSTRSEASTTSGRGLGVDIILRVVEELGGEAAVRSRPGQGTRFSLKVPLSITIVEAFVLGHAGGRYAVPSSTVEEVIEVDPARVVRTPTAGGEEILLYEHRGAALPLFDLGALLRLPGDAVRQRGVVVRRNRDLFAFATEKVLSRQEVVVRRLEHPVVRVPGVTGATDLGDGHPVLVLDLVALASKGAGREVQP